MLISLMLVVSSIMFFSCEPGGNNNNNNGPSGIVPAPAPALADNFVRIYYMDSVPSGTKPGLWMWGDIPLTSETKGSWPTGAFPFNKRDSKTNNAYYLDMEMTNIKGLLGFQVLTDIPKGDSAKDGVGDRKSLL